MTQFAQALDDPVFTKQQYDMYLKLVEPYRYKCFLALPAHAKAGRSLTLYLHRERFFNIIKVSKGAKIRYRYNQVQHLTQGTNEKVTNSQ